MQGRALHFVLKVADRECSMDFYCQLLGMTVLRHEEFEEGCKALCNGPYDGKWSKTMVGFGPEDNHFVIELTYNYSVGSYKLGNDLVGINVQSSPALDRARAQGILQEQDGRSFVTAPGGYKFFLEPSSESDGAGRVTGVTLASSNLAESIVYWKDTIQMEMLQSDNQSAVFSFGQDQAKLELVQIAEAVDHGSAFGRIAFSIPTDNLQPLEALITGKKYTVLTSLLRLDTPGKASVSVVILADPDGHEICFVGDEGFKELSKVDPNAGDLLKEAIIKDKSKEWFEKKGKSKQAAA